MTFLHQIRRIERMDFFINARSTGTPSEFAQKLGISRSQLHQIIRVMRKELEAPLLYSRLDQTYHYGEDVHFVCEFRKM